MTLGKRLFWLTNLAPLMAALAAIGICWLLYLQEPVPPHSTNWIASRGGQKFSPVFSGMNSKRW